MAVHRRKVGGGRSPRAGAQPVLFANKAHDRKMRDAAAAAALAREKKKSRSTTHLDHPPPGTIIETPKGARKGQGHVTDDVLVVVRSVQGLDRVQLARLVLHELATSQ